MNEELAYRVLAYLIAHYKTHDETIINKEEINAINFIIEENKQQKEVIQTYETLLKTNIEENKQLKEQLETSEKARKEALSMINSKEYVIDFSTFGYELNNYEIFKLKNILDIDKGE